MRPPTPLELLVCGKPITAAYVVVSRRDSAAKAQVEFRDGTRLTMSPVLRPEVTGLRFDVLLPEQRAITAPTRRRFPLGDGALHDRDLAGYFVGQTLDAIEDGAMSEEGVDVVRMTCRGGNVALVFAQRSTWETKAVTGLDAVVTFVFLPAVASLVVTPGMAR